MTCGVPAPAASSTAWRARSDFGPTAVALAGLATSRVSSGANEGRSNVAALPCFGTAAHEPTPEKKHRQREQRAEPSRRQFEPHELIQRGVDSRRAGQRILKWLEEETH